MFKFIIPIFLFLLSFSSHAHLFPTEGELTITKKTISLHLRIPLRDKFSFPELFPESSTISEEKLKAFAEKSLIIQSHETVLIPTLTKQEIENLELPSASLRPGQKRNMEVHKFYHFHLEYKLPKGSSKLTLTPPGSAEDSLLMSPTFFQLKLSINQKAYLNEFYLNKKTYLEIDWKKLFKTELYIIDLDDDKIEPSHFAGESLIAQNFLYINPYDIKIESLIPYRFFTKELKKVNQSPRLEFTIEEQKAAQKLLNEILAKTYELKVNGMTITPKTSDLRFIDFNASSLMHSNESKHLETSDTLIAYNCRYTFSKPPQSVGFQWKKFSNNTPKIQCSILARGEDIQHKNLEKGQDKLSWTRQKAFVAPNMKSLKVSDNLYKKGLPIYSFMCFPIAFICLFFFLTEQCYYMDYIHIVVEFHIQRINEMVQHIKIKSCKVALWD